MGPSYMATREEEHSPRGRANALVRALSMPDPRAALGDPRLHEILDLCLECRTCRIECPLSCLVSGRAFFAGWICGWIRQWRPPRV